MKYTKISIIVPVYNGEEFLSKCIESIVMQTEKDLELILIDDGSSDNSGLLCDQYARSDSRIKVIHQKNAGVSAARNRGINIASGEYIGFVDSDDWVEPNMFERLLQEARNTDADIVMCDATTVYDDGHIQVDTITQLSGNQILKKSDFTPSILLEMAGSACRCIYKNNRYNDKPQKCDRLLFPLGVKFSEDRIFNLYAFGQANKVAYMKEAFYNRYMNKKSAVHRFHADYFEAYKKASKEIEKAIAVAWDNLEEYQTAYLRQFINGSLMAVCNYYYKTSTLDKASRKKGVKKICNDSELRKAIYKTGFINRPSKWVIKYKVNFLIIYARLAKLKHRR